MRVTIHLTEKDITEAVTKWLAGQSMSARGPIRTIVTPGDRPGESSTTTFEIEAESVPATQR